MTVTGHAHRRGRRGRRLASAVVIAASVASVSTSLQPASAAQTAPAGRVALASQTTWVAAGETFELRVDVADVRSPRQVELVVTVHDAVTSRSQFARTVDGRLLGRTLRTVSAPIADLDFDAAGAIRVSLPTQGPDQPAEPARLPPLRPGVYPVDVSLRAEGTRLDGFTTHLVRVPDGGDAPPLNVAWVQPFHAPVALRPDGDVDLSPRRAAQLATVAAALEQARVPLSIVPTPETVDALGALGRDEVLSDLRAAIAGRQVIARPYVDIDIAAVDRLDAELAAQRSRGSEVLAETLGVRPDPRTWSADEPLAHDAVAVLADLGVDRLVLPENGFSPLDLQLTLAQPFLVDAGDRNPLPAATVDSALADHFLVRDPVLGAHRLLADLAVLFYDAPGTQRGVVVRPPSRWSPAAELLSVALHGLATSPVVRAVTVDDLFDRVKLLQRRREAVVREPTAEPAAALPDRAILDARRFQEGFRDMLTAENDVTDALDRLILAAQADDLGRRARRAYLDGARALLDQQLEGIRLLDSSYRLTAREGSLPLTLVNDNPYPVTVDIRLESEKLEFPANGGAGDHTITAELKGQNTAMAVPVAARTPGAFQLRVTLASPDGGLEISRTRVTVRSTFVSGVGVVLSAGAGIFLLLWWARHWRTARRDRRLVSAES